MRVKLLFTQKMRETYLAEPNNHGHRFNRTRWVDRTVEKNWSRKHTFIRRTHYSEKLWALGSETRIDGERTWVIDLREAGSFHIKGMLRQVDLPGSDDEYLYVSSTLEYVYTEDDVLYCEAADCYILSRYAKPCGPDGDEGVITPSVAEWLDYQWVSCWNCYLSDPHDYDLNWTEDTNRWIHMDDGFWCEEDECFYEDEDNVRPYQEPDREHIIRYHSSLRPEHRFDASLSRPTVWFGYEVEKGYDGFENEDGDDSGDQQGGYVGERELFNGYEQDGSCGVEAITHILAGDLQNIPYITRLANDAHNILDSRTNGNCGGHWTFSVDGMTGAQLADKVRLVVGSAVYAMFPNRITNQFCRADARLEERSANGYRAMRVYRDRIEFRTPDRYDTTEEFIARHEVYVTIVRMALAGMKTKQVVEDTVFQEVMGKWLVTHYREDKTLDEVIEQMKLYNLWLMNGVPHNNIRESVTVPRRPRRQQNPQTPDTGRVITDALRDELNNTVSPLLTDVAEEPRRLFFTFVEEILQGRGASQSIRNDVRQMLWEVNPRFTAELILTQSRDDQEIEIIRLLDLAVNGSV